MECWRLPAGICVTFEALSKIQGSVQFSLNRGSPSNMMRSLNTSSTGRGNPYEECNLEVPPQPPRRRGRPRKDEPKAAKNIKRLAKQARQKASVSIAQLDMGCAWGCKKNSQGNVSFWKGYKLHDRHGHSCHRGGHGCQRARFPGCHSHRETD